MAKVYVKLKDKGGIFHDASQDFTLSGSVTIAETELTPKVAAGLKGGVIEKLADKAAYEAACKERGQAVAGEVVKAKDATTGATGGATGGKYDSLLKAELVAECEKRGLDIKDAKTNALLIKLLEDNDTEAEAAK